MRARPHTPGRTRCEPGPHTPVPCHTPHASSAPHTGTHLVCAWPYTPGRTRCELGPIHRQQQDEDPCAPEHVLQFPGPGIPQTHRWSCSSQPDPGRRGGARRGCSPMREGSTGEDNKGWGKQCRERAAQNTPDSLSVAGLRSKTTLDSMICTTILRGRENHTHTHTHVRVHKHTPSGSRTWKPMGPSCNSQTNFCVGSVRNLALHCTRRSLQGERNKETTSQACGWGLMKDCFASHKPSPLGLLQPHPQRENSAQRQTQPTNEPVCGRGMQPGGSAQKNSHENNCLFLTHSTWSPDVFLLEELSTIVHTDQHTHCPPIQSRGHTALFEVVFTSVTQSYFLTSASKFNIEPNGGICDVSTKTNSASPNVEVS